MTSWRQTFLWGCFTFFWTLLTVPLTVLGILFAAPFLGPRKAFFTIGPLWARQMFWISGITLDRRGWEALPEDIRSERKPVIFMSNHESQMDPPLLVSAIPVPAVYIAKKEVKLIPFVGWAAMCAGVIWIDRGKRDRAIQSIREAADKIRRGRNVVIFVEGTRTHTGALLPFKKGGFQLAMDAGVPIVPMATVGGFQTLPRGTIFVRPGCYVVSFGEPVDTASYASREDLMQEVRSRIEALIADAKKAGSGL
jgi:1-acyl-sn-glycerol-3-phosphate acyltransferase